MRICILKESLCVGGTERAAANTSILLEKGHTIFTVLYDGGNVIYPYGGKLIDMRLPPRPTKLGKIFNTFRRYAKCRKILKKNQIDVLLQYTTILNYLTILPFRSTVKIIAARDYAIMHRFKARFHAALSNSQAMICNSAAQAQCYLKDYPQDQRKVFVLHNSIDADYVRSQSQETLDEAFTSFLRKHPRNLVSIGRFCKGKGFLQLLTAFAELTKTHAGVGLVLVGDGEEMENCRALTKKLGIEQQVYFAGRQENPFPLMAACDIYVSSSVSEGFPNALLEAMALSLPVVATNCLSGPAELLMDEADYSASDRGYVQCAYGILTPPIDRDEGFAICELTKALTLLLGDPELLKTFAEKSERRVKDFSEEVSRKKLCAILEQVTKAALD